MITIPDRLKTKLEKIQLFVARSIPHCLNLILGSAITRQFSSLNIPTMALLICRK